METMVTHQESLETFSEVFQAAHSTSPSVEWSLFSNSKKHVSIGTIPGNAQEVAKVKRDEQDELWLRLRKGGEKEKKMTKEE